MLGGSRNSRALRLTIGGVLVLVSLYFMYTWRSEALVKGRDLSNTEMEYQALKKRFEKLNQELRDAVKRESQLEQENKDQRLSYVQLQNEKESIHTECTEKAREFKNEKRVLENHNAELTEQRDHAEKEKVDTNVKLQQLTVEYNELKQSAQQKYATLEESCDQATDVCNGKLSAKERELVSAQTDLADISHRLDDCNGQLPVLRESVESCHRQLDSQESNGRNRAEEIKQLQDQLKKQQEQNQQISRELKNTQRGGPPKLPDNFRLKRQVLNEEQFVPRDQKPKSDSNDVFGQPSPGDGNWRGGIHDNPGEQQQPDSHNSDGIKIPEEEKRRIFLAIQDRVNRGEELDERQRQIYRLLYKYYGKTSSKDSIGDHQVEKPELDHAPNAQVPHENEDQGQVPPVQHMFIQELGGDIKAPKKPSQEAEQEEVKDLIEGHQKPGEFDNLGKADSRDNKELEEGGGVDVNRANQGEHDNVEGDDDDELDEDGADDEDYHGRVAGLQVEDDQQVGKKDSDNPIPNPVEDPDQAFNRAPNDHHDEYDYNDIEEDYGRRMFEKDKKIGIEERKRLHRQNVEMRRAVGEMDSQRKQSPLENMDNDKIHHREVR